MKSFRLFFFYLFIVICFTISPNLISEVYASGGYWEMFGAELDKSGKDRDYIKRVTSNKSGTFVVQAQFFDRQNKHIDNWTGAFRWGKLPRNLIPGNKLALTINHAITYKPKVDVGRYESIVGMRMQAPTSDGWADRFTPADVKGKRGSQVHSRVREDYAVEFTPITDITPGTKAGDKMAVTVVVWHAGQLRWDWRYIYVWRSGTPPAETRNDAIPSATEWNGRDPFPATPEGKDRNEATTESTTDDTGKNEESGTITPGPGPVVSENIPDLKNRNDIPAMGMLLVADRRKVKSGGQVWLPIRLVRGSNVGNMNFQTKFDAGIVLTTGQVSKGNVVGNSLFSANPNRAGEVLIGFAGNGVSGTGTVAQIEFRATGKPGTSSEIALNVTRIDGSRGEQLQIATVNGRIDVLTADGRVPGDFNGNDRLDLADALAALKMSVKLILEDLICDADSDKSVTSNDARILFQRVSQR
ncbi:MAG: cohesin domain-containing protein [Gammaproteobacteria bacterium]|nr:cohesin domain-containing protein [Gammaproteobacteria bacterium]